MKANYVIINEAIVDLVG